MQNQPDIGIVSKEGIKVRSEGDEHTRHVTWRGFVSPRVTEHNMRAKHTSAYEHSPPRGTLHAYNKKKGDKLNAHLLSI